MNSFSPVPKPRHNRRVKKRGERGKFSKMIRDEVKIRYNNQCAVCYQRGHHIHHVMPKSRGGRKVFTNALLLCNTCHKEVHAENKLLNYWIRTFKEMYGKHFYHDRDDLESIYKTEFFKKSNLEVQTWIEHNEVFEIFRK
ncbi:HNH endonuclease [Peribacillus muralis]|uniref:HNH endonuclease n=1 Tax=Peribacillus muralis TaxID=264697 RepID=UPI003D000260